MALRTEVRVGIFVAAGLAVMAMMVFLIGQTHRMFETKATYLAEFEDVEGLNAGAQVLMGGVNIGHVAQVSYPEDAMRSEVLVELSIVRSEARRIREDSRVKVAPKGMLGDKQIIITKGTMSEPQIPEGQKIPSSQERSLFAQVEQLGEKFGSVLGNLEKTSGALAQEDFHDDMQTSMHSVRSVLENLDHGNGYLPRLLKDKDEAERLSQAVSNLERSTAQLNQVLRRVDQVLARVNEGPGFAHDVVYGKEGTESVQQIGHAAEEIAVTLQGIREGDGLAHSLLYGGPDDTNTERALADLAAITGDVREMVRDLKQGKGTLGALMVDPSVYEDLKVLLGNVQRNEVLRALVRYSIQRDEKRRVPAPQDRTPASATAKGSLSTDP